MSAQELHIPIDPQVQRAWLKKWSNWIKSHVGKSTPYKSINHYLMAKYRQELGVENLLTASQWARSGYQPKNGIDGLPIWGRQRKTKSKDCPGGYTFFPIDHVFHEYEVKPIPSGPDPLDAEAEQSQS